VKELIEAGKRRAEEEERSKRASAASDRDTDKRE
jgi:hypothetical protein